jgi:hypothetical protein
MNLFLKPSQAQWHYWIFQGLLLLGSIFHHTEDWRDRVHCYVAIATLVVFVLSERLRNGVFLLFLLFAIYSYGVQFPDLANHSNLSFFVFLLLLLPQVKLTLLSREIEYHDIIKTLRLCLVTLYFFTIFHKLNWDFINPTVSCANDKLRDYLELIPPQWDSLYSWAETLIPFLGLSTEAIIPMALIIPRFRNFGILFVIILHFVLAPMGFTDFSSLALAMAWTFVQPHSSHELVWRHFQYLSALCLLIVFGLAPSRFPNRIETHEILEGALFAWAYIPFLYLYYRGHVDLSVLRLPKNPLLVIFVALFFFFGFNNYLGLRTSGTFSMFSNLVTEGDHSNHMLLGSNPFKIWGFQEDVVEIVAVTPAVQGFYRHMPYPGQLIPKVEFVKILEALKKWPWTDVRMKVIYQGKTFATERAGKDPHFVFRAPWYQKKLMLFRAIQKQGPQKCSW